MFDLRLIESDDFPFEFLSQIAERESWRKEIHRPIYHVHKWWAKRLGSIFRGILLGSLLPNRADLRSEFYRDHSFAGLTVFDPFMGSGTTIGEAHKLGLTALGRDINPVAVEAVQTALGPLDRQMLLDGVERLSDNIGRRICDLYRSRDSRNRPCDVLYYFWVMQAACPACQGTVDLFTSYIIARNATPNKKPQVQILCPFCASIFEGVNGVNQVECSNCAHQFDATVGTTEGAKGNCPHCQSRFTVVDAVGLGFGPPKYRLYAKLVLTSEGGKEYMPATADDVAAYRKCSQLLKDEIREDKIRLPDLQLARGYNTRQAMNYGFTMWRDFFNDRQLLALCWLRAGIEQLSDASVRKSLLTLFSGVLEFNNLFASYKGEGTGAVRHMFSHHILKPERMSIEAHVWGTPKSSGSFTNLFRSRLLRAIEYKEYPTEIFGRRGPSRLCAQPFTGKVEREWPTQSKFFSRGIYLSCGDSAWTELPACSIDLAVTDPPFFDNVHYSELADFFFSWQQLTGECDQHSSVSTRHPAEVQDTDSDRFALKLQAVFRECNRVLKDDGLLVFSYHHSRDEGWRALAEAVWGAGFQIVNAQPVKSEMSVATPKAQAKDPIQLDIIIVCRKHSARVDEGLVPLDVAIGAGRAKIRRLQHAGFALSRNDKKIVLYGQALTSISDSTELSNIAMRVDAEVTLVQDEEPSRPRESNQQYLFEELR